MNSVEVNNQIQQMQMFILQVRRTEAKQRRSGAMTPRHDRFAQLIRCCCSLCCAVLAVFVGGKGEGRGDCDEDGAGVHGRQAAHRDQPNVRRQRQPRLLALLCLSLRSAGCMPLDDETRRVCMRGASGERMEKCRRSGGAARGCSERASEQALTVSQCCCLPSLAAAASFAAASMALNAEHEKAKKDFITQKKMSVQGARQGGERGEERGESARRREWSRSRGNEAGADMSFAVCACAVPPCAIRALQSEV